jgi:hypothetical protein
MAGGDPYFDVKYLWKFPALKPFFARTQILTLGYRTE